jgi:cytoskeletal protein RodZ
MSHADGLQHSYGPELVAEQNNAPEVYHPPAHLEHNPNGQPNAQVNGYKPYNEYAEKQAVTTQHESPSGTKRRILGLPVAVFWTIVGLVVLLVLGVALGAGLGVGLKHNDSTATPTSTSAKGTPSHAPVTTTSTSISSQSSSTRTSTAAPTQTSFVTSGTHGIAANSCNSTSPKQYNIDSTEFTAYCFSDWPNGAEAADGSSTVKDLDALTVYTFEDCMQECLDYNQGLSGNATQCKAITYNANLTSILEVGQQGGDCFLKNTNGATDGTGSVNSACAVIAD